MDPDATRAVTPGTAPHGAADPEGVRPVALLGATLFAVWWLLPTALGGTTRPWLAAAAALPPLALLAVGARALRDGRPGPASWALLAGVPVALGGAQAAVFPTLAAPPGPGPGWVVTALALLAYGAAAARALARSGPARRGDRRPLEASEGAPARPPGTVPRRWLLGGATAGALALVLSPAATRDPESFAEAWGPAQTEAALLVAAVSTALGVSVLAVFVGPGLRASRERPPSPAERRSRVARAITLAALGVLAWLAFGRR